MRNWGTRILIGILAIVLLMLIAGFAYEQWSRSDVADRYKPKGRLINVNGQATHLYCTGTGSPTVLLESGLDSFGSLSWALVQPAIAKTNRVCSYDRAGIAWSEPSEEVPGALHVAEHLRTLVELAGEQPPFIIVGHSLGGLHARAFVDRYQKDVAGLVLVDSSHPEQATRLPQEAMAEVATPPLLLVQLLAEIGVIRILQPFSAKGIPPEAQIAYALIPQNIAALFAEVDAIDQVLAQASQVKSLGTLPLIVLSRGKEPEELPPQITAAIGLEVAAVWSQLQAELANLSANSEQRVIADAGHYIQFDNPDAVIQAIQDVAAHSRNSEALIISN